MGERRVGRMEWSGGGKWGNCNSIINKYIKKKKKRKKKKFNDPFITYTVSVFCEMNILPFLLRLTWHSSGWTGSVFFIGNLNGFPWGSPNRLQ